MDILLAQILFDTRTLRADFDGNGHLTIFDFRILHNEFAIVRPECTLQPWQTRK